jgi:hypothetical protein
MRKFLCLIFLFLTGMAIFLTTAGEVRAAICAPEEIDGCYCSEEGGDCPYLCFCPGDDCGECDPFQTSCCNTGGGCPAYMPCQNIWCWNYNGTCKVELVSPYGYDCEPVFSYQDCGATDSCLGTDRLNAGLCTSSGCAIGGEYKTCCNALGGTDLCIGGNYTGVCPNLTVFCGWGGYPPCGPAACGGTQNTPTPTPTPPPGCVDNCGDGICCGPPNGTENSDNCCEDCGVCGEECWYCTNPASCVFGNPGDKSCGCASCSYGRIGGLVYVDKNGNGTWDGDAVDSRVSTGGACRDRGVADTLIPGLEIFGAGSGGYTQDFTVDAAGDCDVLNTDRPNCALEKSTRCWEDSCITCSPGHSGTCPNPADPSCTCHDAWGWCWVDINHSCYTQWYECGPNDGGCATTDQAGSFIREGGKVRQMVDPSYSYNGVLGGGRMYDYRAHKGYYDLQLQNLPPEWEIVQSPGVAQADDQSCHGPYYFGLRFNNDPPELVGPITIYPPGLPNINPLTGVDRHSCHDDPPQGEEGDIYYFISTHEDPDGANDIETIGLSFVDVSNSANRLTLISTGTDVLSITGGGVVPAGEIILADSGVEWTTISYSEIQVVWKLRFNTSGAHNIIFATYGATVDKYLGGEGVWTDTGDRFKIWDCQVNLYGTFYDVSADYPTENCSTMYCSPVGYGGSLDANFIALVLSDVTPGTVTGSFDGLDNLIYRESYLADISGTDVQVNYLSFGEAGNGDCDDCDYGGNNTSPCCDKSPLDYFLVNTTKGTNPYDNDPRITINTGILGLVEAWYQLEDTGARARLSIGDVIPESCVNSPDCVGALAWGVDFDNGPVVANQTINPGGEGTVVGDPNNWEAEQAGAVYSGLKYDYDYFDEKISDELVANPPSGTTYYKIGAGEFGSWGSYLPFGSVGSGEKVIMLVDDDVDVEIDISVAEGGLFMLIVSGDITVEDSVNTVQGVLVADGTISVEDSPNETQLNLAGVLAGDVNLDGGGVVLGRDRGVYNLTSPGVVFDYRPDMLFALPLELQENVIEWREIEP